MTAVLDYVAAVAEFAAWWTLASLTAGLLLARLGRALRKPHPTPPEHR
ncbi:hypothetical protein [Streptomyces sp.]